MLSEFPNQKHWIPPACGPSEMPRWGGGGAPIFAINPETKIVHERRRLTVTESGIETYHQYQQWLCTWSWNCPDYNLGISGLHWPRRLKGTDDYDAYNKRHYYVRPGYAEQG